MKLAFIFILVTTTILSACDTDQPAVTSEVVTTISNEQMASIVSVTTSGTVSNYTFSVGIASPDTGCNQYADWWEVVTEDGILLYRRILAHSHVNEQPFVRSGGSVAITDDQIVIIRAHMNTSGYGTIAFLGSVNEGFTETTLDVDFAQSLATAVPLPDGCAF